MPEERKRHIRQKFDRAATTYDEHATVQHEVARRLADLLPEQKGVESILEIGCGTGRYSRLLRQRYPQARITALDFAVEMVAQARQKVGGDVEFLCEDGERYLARCQQHFMLVSSNATMQWFADLGAALGHIQRCLLPGGQAVFSLFGPRSLHCLAAALSHVFQRAITVPSQQFLGKDEVEDVAAMFFPQVAVERLCLTQRYGSFHELLVAIKTTGTGGYQQGLPPLTRRRMAEIEQWFARRGGVQVEYEVFFVRARKEDV